MSLMQISRRVDYGLGAVIYLSGQDPEKCCSITEIAKQQGVPRKFLEKIIQDLIRKGLIKSRRGSCGGYMLPRCTMVGVWSEVQRRVIEVFTSTKIADLRQSPCNNFVTSSLSSAA